MKATASNAQSLALRLLPDEYAVCRMDPEARPVVKPAGPDTFCSISHAPGEISIICPVDMVPEGSLMEGGWRCLMVRGPLDLNMIGVLRSLSQALSGAGISLLVQSTYDTDFVFVREPDLKSSITALSGAGFSIK
jgi:hypothetical protein